MSNASVVKEDIVKEIYKKIHTINYDLDEILQKHSKGWKLDASINSFFKCKKLEVREDIKFF